MAEKLEAITRRLQYSIIILLASQASFFMMNIWMVVRDYSRINSSGGNDEDDDDNDIDDWYKRVPDFQKQKALSYVSNNHPYMPA